MDEKEKTKIYKNKNGKRKKEKKTKSKVRKIIGRVFLILLFIVLIVAGILVGKVYSIMKNAKLDMSQIAIQYENSVAKDINGETIAVFSGDENRKIINLSEMSNYIPKAFVAIEDERFEEHGGVDIKRTASATVKWGLSKIGIGSANYGGSTITQQLVKNLTKEDERSSTRKIKEMARAYYIEQELSKNQILELYLNLIFLGGNNICGVEVASNYYFSKSANELTLAESAFLAGINHSPNSYNPFVDEEDKAERMELINKRVKTVLAKMLELGKINGEEYDAALSEVEQGIVFVKGKVVSNMYSYHTDAAVEQVIKDLMELHPDWSRDYTSLYVKSGGLTIYTTQNTAVQNALQTEFEKTKYQISSKKTKDEDGNYVTSQAAMVVIDHKTGYVVGTVGGLGEKTTSFGLNRATQSIRQTGSSMKPLAVLVPGIEEGTITAASVFDDVPTTFAGGTYPVKNYGSYNGLETVRYAIGTSQNIPMVKAIQQIGVGKSIEYLKKMGISTINDEKDNYLGLALGGITDGISPLEMAAAYATIANDGVYIEPIFYTKVVDSEGNTILESKQETRTVISKAAAYVIKEILTQPVKTGTATYCSISGMSVAAKTGTTDDDFDRWLCGFTPYYTASCWYGFDDNEDVDYYLSSNPAASLWDGVMTEVHKGLESKYFSSTRPEGVVAVTVCKASGLIPTEECKNDPRGDQTYTEYFVRGTVPTESCNCHVKVKICNETGLLANENACTDVTEKVFITRPDVETNTSWQRAKDAQYTLTITDNCATHVIPEEPIEPEKPEEPVEPEEPDEQPEKPNKPDDNIGDNVVDGNTVGDENNTEGNGTSAGNVTEGNNTVTGNEISNNTTE